MIRVPFFSNPSKSGDVTCLVTLVDQIPSLSRSAKKTDDPSARLDALEIRLVSQAEELRSQISDRVMRIHSRIERALRPFQPESEREKVERSTDNIVEFGRTRKEKGSVPEALLHVRNTREAMLELNETLLIAQDHLEALSASIDRMRKSVGSR